MGNMLVMKIEVKKGRGGFSGVGMAEADVWERGDGKGGFDLPDLYVCVNLFLPVLVRCWNSKG